MTQRDGKWSDHESVVNKIKVVKFGADHQH